MVNSKDDPLEKILTLRIRRGTKTWLDKVAGNLGLPVASYIRLILEQHTRTPIMLSFERPILHAKKRGRKLERQGLA